MKRSWLSCLALLAVALPLAAQDIEGELALQRVKTLLSNPSATQEQLTEAGQLLLEVLEGDYSAGVRSKAHYLLGSLYDYHLPDHERCLHHYRTYLQEGTNDRLLEIARDRIAELEKRLSQGLLEAERRIEKLKKEFASADEARKDELLEEMAELCQKHASSDIGRWHFELGELYSNRRRWTETLDSYRTAKERGYTHAGHIDEKIEYARKHMVRMRIARGAELVLAFSFVIWIAMLSPWRLLRRGRRRPLLLLVLPWAALLVSFTAVYYKVVAGDPESHFEITYLLVFSGLSLYVALFVAALSLTLVQKQRPGLASLLAPLSALVLALCAIAVFFGEFRYFHMIGL